MADKKWQTGGNILIAAQGVVCLIATVAPFGAAWGLSDSFAATSDVGSADPNMVWQMLIGGIVFCSFLAAVALWILSALRKDKRLQLRRNAFVRSALNNLSHGVVMADAQQRIMFCNDRYFEIYGLARSDIPTNVTGPELLEMRLKRGVLSVSVEDFYLQASTPEGFITELPGERSVLVKIFSLPNGGWVSRHEDCNGPRKLSGQPASTQQFLEKVLHNCPACVGAKSIEDRPDIFSHRGSQ